MKKLILLALAAFLPGITEAQIGSARTSLATTTVSTSPAYASGDLIGGLLTFGNILRDTQPTGYVLSACVYDKSAQAVDMELILLTEPFSAATVLTDNGAFAPADADLSKMLPPIALGSSSRFQFLNNGIKCVTVPALPVVNSSTTKRNLYGVLISRGTPTFSSTSDISVEIGVSRD